LTTQTEKRFSVLAMLNDSQGDGQGKLAVYGLDDRWLRQDEIYT
jgi:hypothetical protein